MTILPSGRLLLPLLLVAVTLSSLALADIAIAQTAAEVAPVAEPPPTLNQAPLNAGGGGLPVDFLWTVVAAVLVFWMQASR